MIHPTAVIYPGCVIGEDVWIGPYAVIGSPAEIRGSMTDQGMVTVGDGTVIRENVTIQGKVRIGSDCYVMDRTHIAHDCIIGDRVTLSPGVLLAGHVTVEDDANIGMGAAVHQGRTIGRGAMVGGLAFVTKDVPPFEKWFGVPAVKRGMNEKKLAELEVDWLAECYD